MLKDHQFYKGLVINFYIDYGSSKFPSRVLHPDSGRTLEIYSNQPGLQFYTGNDLPDPDRVYPPDFEDYCNVEDEVRRFEFSLIRIFKASEMSSKIRYRYRKRTKKEKKCGVRMVFGIEDTVDSLCHPRTTPMQLT